MKKLLLLIILAPLLWSCRYFNVSPVDGFHIKYLSEKPDTSAIVGLWEVDKVSYDLIKQNGYTGDFRIELKFNSDGTFEAINFPDIVNSFKALKDHQLHQTKGKWKIEDDDENNLWKLFMKFETSLLFDHGMSISYDLYLKDDHLIIWNFIGDPDSGERFLFEKVAKTS